MPNRNQKPPAPLVEGEQYEWDEFRQAYVGETEDGTEVVWFPDNQQWRALGTVQGGETSGEQGKHTVPPGEATPEQRAAITRGLGGETPPTWWDEDKFGPFPDWWDSQLYGAFPKIEYENGDEEPDLERAIKRADSIDARTAKGKKTPLPQGALPTQTRGKEEYRWNEDTGKYDILVKAGGTVGTTYRTYDEAVAAAPEGFVPVPETLSDGSTIWTFKAADTITPYQQAQIDLQRQQEARLQKAQDYSQRRTVDDIEDELWQKALAGDEEAKSKLFMLDGLRDEMDKPRGLTPQQATEFIMGLAVSPDEAGAWIDALTQDWQQGQFIATGQMQPVPPNPFKVGTGSSATGATGSNVFPGSEAFAGWGQTPPGGSNAVPGEQRFDEDGNPDPNGIYNADGDNIGLPTATPFGNAVAPAGFSTSQNWLRNGSGHTIVDPNPGTTTPGRFYDTDNHVWEPMDAYNERMARFKTAQAQVPANATGMNAPPVGWGTARFVPNDQWNAMTPEERQAYFEPGGPGYVPPAQQQAEAQARQPGFKAASSTSQATTPFRVSSPSAGLTSGPKLDLPRFQGNEAVYEQTLFGVKKPDLQTALLQAKHRKLTAGQQARFQARPVPQRTYR